MARAFSHHPAYGVAAVLLGAVISTLNTRISTIGLADIRGGLSLGFDTGSWLTSLFAAGQILVVPVVAALNAAFGARRILLTATVVHAVGSFVLPFMRDDAAILALQLIRGLAIGAYIPAFLPFVVRVLPPRWLVWGLAAYAFRFVFSQNIGVSVEAWLSDTRGWEWVFWHNTVTAPLLIALIWFGMPPAPVERNALRQVDWWAMVYLGLGLALVVAGLDQGNRLDWLHSGTVVGLLGGGALLIAAFAINELLTPRPLVRLAVRRDASLGVAMFMIVVYGLGVTGTAFLVPQYLAVVQLQRPLQIGNALIWIALPQLMLIPVTALLVRVVDARLVLALGFALMALGSWLDTALTNQWNAETFQPSQALEAVGLAFAITAVIFFIVANTTPADALTLGVLIQSARLLGSETTTAFIQTYVRVREQVQSNLLGLHVQQGSPLLDRSMAALTDDFAARSSGLGEAAARGIGTLHSFVQREANVLAFIDGFFVIACALTAAMLLILLMRRPPPNVLTPPLLRP